MQKTVTELKKAFREILGDEPSPMLLGRIDRTLDDGEGDITAVCEACSRVEKLVRLFICIDKAEAVGRRWREIVGGPRQWA